MTGPPAATADAGPARPAPPGRVRLLGIGTRILAAGLIGAMCFGGIRVIASVRRVGHQLTSAVGADDTPYTQAVLEWLPTFLLLAAAAEAVAWLLRRVGASATTVCNTLPLLFAAAFASVAWLAFGNLLQPGVHRHLVLLLAAVTGFLGSSFHVTPEDPSGGYPFGWFVAFVLLTAAFFGAYSAWLGPHPDWLSLMADRDRDRPLRDDRFGHRRRLPDRPL